jgi:hydrogenase maturation protease
VVLRVVADLSGEGGPMPSARRPMVIIGCGNLNRQDDGVGVRVIHRLREQWLDDPPQAVRLFDAGTGGMEVMFQARGAGALVIVDACRSGSEPGAVFRLPGSEIDQAHQPTYSLHDFRWDHAVYAGRRIFGHDFPADLTVYLVEAQAMDLGTELTEPVQAAVDKVCVQIDAQVRQWCTATTA